MLRGVDAARRATSTPPPCSGARTAGAAAWRAHARALTAWPAQHAALPAGHTAGSRRAARAWLAAAHAAAPDGSDGAGSSPRSAAADFQLAAPLSSPQGTQLVGIIGEPAQLFDQFVAAFIDELKQERQREKEMEEAAAADAAAEAAEAVAAAAAASGGSSEEQGEASSSWQQQQQQQQDAADTWNDAALMKRIKALREAERGQVVVDVLYMSVAHRMFAHGLQLLGDLTLLAPAGSRRASSSSSSGTPSASASPSAPLPSSFVSAHKLVRSRLLSPAVIDAVLSYMASSFEGGDGELMRVASPAATPLSVDRVQGARLYAGLLEFGYFAAALEAACVAAGVDVGADSAAMINHANSLAEAELRQLCAVKSADAWWGAVRHTGAVFGLRRNEDPWDSFGLPYPDLAVTISQIRMEPAANIWEHFNTPGSSARLAAKAADKAARGWAGEGLDGDGLPEADMVAFEFANFQRLLLEAAVYGALLFGAERQLEQQHGYELSSRRDREEQAAQPPL